LLIGRGGRPYFLEVFDEDVADLFW